MTNRIDDVMSTIDSVSVDVHIIEGNSYRRGHKKVFTIQNHEGITKEGFKTSKIRSVGPESVQYHRLITYEGCSVREVLLYVFMIITNKILN
jgi:hypothetical protein